MLLPSRGQTPVQVENKVPTVIIHSNARITVDGANIQFENLEAVLDSKLAGQLELDAVHAKQCSRFGIQ